MRKYGRLLRTVGALTALWVCSGAKKPPWDESRAGAALELAGAKMIHNEEFEKRRSFRGPILWAKQHADVGLEKYDAPGGAAYSIDDGHLVLTAYKNDAGVIRSGNVQSLHADQSYQGKFIHPGVNGFTCVACYWETRALFPKAYGTWAAFWLLTPDRPGNRGHLEVDAIEFYGLADARGHHHSWHRWETKANGGHTYNSNYVGMEKLTKFGWHTYGVDLRGIAKVDGKPAMVIYFDRREVARYAVDPDFFSKPFYYLLTLSVNPKDKKWTFPQSVRFDYVKVWR